MPSDPKLLCLNTKISDMFGSGSSIKLQNKVSIIEYEEGFNEKCQNTVKIYENKR